MTEFEFEAQEDPTAEADDWMVGGPEPTMPPHIGEKTATALVTVETAFLASTTALIWLINTYVPTGPLLRMFFPLPIALAYLRWGKRAAWMTAVVAALLLSVLMGPPRSVQFFLPYGILGVILGGCWRSQRGWAHSMGWGVLISALGLFFQIFLLSLLLATNVWLYLNQQVTGILDWLFIKLNLLINPDLWVVQLFAVGLIFVNATLYLLLVHLVASLLFERLKYPIPDPPPWLQAILED
ncbi:DUF2232 domain-containing protein [Lyngbya confervoides]|uniref:DUF2232 domain-containing protein n=1 Tax=Lyngbya confervoides BDU141951 TaxID=1574623 RepID=A0ABD4T5P0_9CYAN|nr:DUF2232 domain-containing protein [Lyngbya confervoides]MCM1984096.1 DUF2232 domain-containing protein [Lyngbya confervoides BDU141951]